MRQQSYCDVAISQRSDLGLKKNNSKTRAYKGKNVRVIWKVCLTGSQTIQTRQGEDGYLNFFFRKTGSKVVKQNVLQIDKTSQYKNITTTTNNNKRMILIY